MGHACPNPALMDCLPNDLLVQILSFLPTKEAVSTSLLSKRWRTLYTLTNNFHDSSFRHRSRCDIQKSFEDFLDRRLAFQGGNNLKKVSIKLTERHEGNCRVVHWICNALERGISELHLFMEEPLMHRLVTRVPSKVFTSTTLVKLSLGRGLKIDSFPLDTSLPALKVLLLDSVCFPPDKLSHMFLAACPALEDLTIHQMHFLEVAYVISSKTIKKLSFTSLGSFHVLSQVFTSTTLVNLSLGKGLKIDSFPLEISLPALKVLLLDSVCFPRDKLSPMFLAACPVLEDLTIHETYFLEVAYVISSKTIKKLSFTSKGSFSIISLDLPSVVDLYYSGYVRNEDPHGNLHSLAKATLDLNYLYKDDADVTNLISRIRNVKSLHLTFSAIEVISACCNGGLPVFNNLVDLVFTNKKHNGKRLLPLMLERSPNLKTLVLSGVGDWTYSRRPFVGFQIPPNSQIKMLSIMLYHGSENELKDIRYFLLKMECLKVVKVYVSSAVNGRKKKQATRNLLQLPTASPKLEMQVI